MKTRKILVVLASMLVMLASGTSAQASGELIYGCLKNGAMSKVGATKPRCIGGSKVIQWQLAPAEPTPAQASLPDVEYGMPDFPVALVENQTSDLVAIAMTADLVAGVTYVVSASTSLDVYFAGQAGMSYARCDLRAPDAPNSIQPSDLQGWGTPAQPVRGTISISRMYTVPSTGSKKIGLHCNAFGSTETQARNTIVTAIPVQRANLSVTTVKRPK